MSLNLFEIMFAHMMADVFTSAVVSEIRRQGDEMIIPNWMFAEEATNNEQQFQEIRERIGRAVGNVAGRIFYGILSGNDEEDEEDEVEAPNLVEPLIPDWLYQDETQHHPIGEVIFTFAASHICIANLYIFVSNRTLCIF